MIDKDTIVVWFSCGAASAVAAKKTIEVYGNDYFIKIVNNPVSEEHHDNQRFLKDVEKWIGVSIESCYNPKYPHNSAHEVWQSRKYMSGIKGAPCTLELKKKARQHWEANNKFDFLVLGFTFDEIKRHQKFIQTEKSNVLPVLIDLKLTKNDCFDILLREGLKLPEIYNLGYPNANCIGCVKATSPTYWNHVRRQHPEQYEQRSTLSRELNVRLVRHKGKRIFLDELPADAIGLPMKNLKSVECGIFCEEKK
jgi:PP-loop superfamily ATP-utilizing enzyme